ncbi:MAG: type II toxin-antitoxin system prevent-host-death family antitoxin [Anaerolineae bacterium]|nr:type II toxin-antitoxin system prevent-host-death family antitoxin [Anaerolineae bacterium]
MERVWQLTEEDSQFTEVVDEALEHGPQVVAKNGHEVAVVISMQEYRRMKQRQSLGEFFRLSPLAGLEELDLERDQTPLETRIEF